jgi:hypothetical protein
MIPIFLKIKVGRKRGPDVKLVIPVILIWLLLLLIMLLFAPLMIFIAMITWPAGYGKLILMIPVMVFSLIANLGDLVIDVKDKKEKIFVAFF